MRKLIADRIEGNFVVCENDKGEYEDIQLNKIHGVKAGDVICFDGKKYVIDKAETESRRKKIISLQNDLWE